MAFADGFQISELELATFGGDKMKMNTRNLVGNLDRFLFICLTSKPNLKFYHQTKFIITPFQQCCF